MRGSWSSRHAGNGIKYRSQDKILLSDIERARLEMRNQRIIQKLAILESELRTLQESRKK